MTINFFPKQANFKEKLFDYSQKFSHITWLDSHLENSEYAKKNKINTLIGLGMISETLIDSKANYFDQLKSFLTKPKWAFGYLSYDLKNEIEKSLVSKNKDLLKFPDLYFFEAETVIQFIDKQVIIYGSNKYIIDEIISLDEQIYIEKQIEYNLNPKASIQKEKYLEKINKIHDKIVRGDVYEINFCHEYFVENCVVNPFDLFIKLSKLSPSPFASFFKKNEHFIISASPERFLKKTGETLLSQPIKGTIKRGKTIEEDLKLKSTLYHSEKERSENVMIVDLVRNDLSQIAKDASVKVDELFGIYSFPQVHQMISSISCQLNKNIHFIDAIKACFPMGSMTGAPKIKAMEIIEEFEESKRSVFSGSIGYFNPKGDFDFNVLIRSIFYNQNEKYLSFSVGSAITYQSIAENEYEETLIKAKAIFEILGAQL